MVVIKMLSNEIISAFISIAGGVLTTLWYSLAASFIGFWLALGIALIRFYDLWGARLLTFFVSVLRGTPVMVQLLFFYFCLPKMGILLPGAISALLAFVLNSAAYIAEILRGGLLGINKGQFLACKTLQIPKYLMWRDIIAPQLIRICLPGLVGEFTAIMKETSLLSIIGEDDIMKRATAIGSATYSYLIPLMVAGIYYYLISSFAMLMMEFVERKLENNVKN